MPGFKSVIASMKAAQTENKTEQTAQVVTEEPKSDAAEHPKGANAEVQTKLTTADRVQRIIAAVKSGFILRTEQTDDDGNKFDVFTAPEGAADNIKTVASHFKYFNAKWEYDDRTFKCVKLPFPVLRNTDAAEAAHQARLDRNARVQERIAKRDAEKGGTTPTPSADGKQTEGTYTEEQMYKFAKMLNKNISDDAIRILLNSL